MDFQRLKEEQDLILDRIDNAIALFDREHHLILFNHKFSQTWELSPEWLAQKPHCDRILSDIAAHGYWSEEQCHQLKLDLLETNQENNSFYIEQGNGICLNANSTQTSNGDRLLIFQDVTIYQSSQVSLNAEVRRLRFLLGLNERLQHSDSAREIAQFALNYLVEVMNAGFGDVKVITGNGTDREAGPLTNQISSQFLAIYGEPAVAGMQSVLVSGIPYGQGLLWEVAKTGQPIYVEDYANHPNAVEGFRHPAIGQLGIFPIPATDGKIIGVLTLESRNLDDLQEAPQKDMLLAACRTLGVAIERAQSQEHLRQINEELERSSQLKSEFLASMSHELRTPLNSILGFSDLLSRQKTDSLSLSQLNHVRLIAKSGKHLLQLIDDILDLSKIEAGKTELNLQPVNIHELCTDCLRTIQPQADKKRLALSHELDYRISTAILDLRRTRQIVINLLSNAIKFTPEKGEVKLSARLAYGNQMDRAYRPDRSVVNPSTPYLCLEVKDSGIGIPEDKWHLLFRPFQQVDSSLTRRHEGTGLGLVLVKRLAELHGGTVSLESQLEKGSVFRVWFPLTEMRDQFAVTTEQLEDNSYQSDSTPTKLPSQKTARILIVEDQLFNQLLLSEVLELEGYETESIADGKTMLETIHSSLVRESSLPDLILMDIQLPGVDGFELIRQLQAHALWQSVPVVAVTAMAMSGDRQRCLDAGASAYLSKPIDIEEAIATVQSLLDSDNN